MGRFQGFLDSGMRRNDGERVNQRFLIFALVAAGVLALQVACTTPRLGESDAALMLEDLVAGSWPSRLKSRTSSPSREEIGFAVGGKRYRGDVYTPADDSAAGIVLVPGVTPAGKDDARLVAFARTLARLRFTVLVPDLPGLRKLRVRSGDVYQVADAFRYLNTELAPGVPGGIMGFSYAAGPSLLAALQPGVRNRVAFVVSVGGYHDLRRLIAFFTTGRYPRLTGADASGPTQRWAVMAPHPYGKWVFARTNADLIEDRGDRAALEAAFADRDWEDSNDGAGMFITGLGPQGQALMNLLLNENPDQVNLLIEKLPPRMRGEIRDLNPAAHDLSRLQAQLILLHGRSDNIIPYSESILLARAVPTARLFLIDGLAHVDIAPEPQDLPILLEATRVLLAQRANN